MMKRSALTVMSIACAAIVLGAQPASGEGDTAARIPELFESSYAHEVTGNVDRALNDTLKILRIAPAHYVANYRAGWLYYSKGRFDDSVKFYKKAVGIAPASVEAKLGLMLPLMAMQRWGEAEDIGKQIVRKCPSNYLAGSRLAFIYFSLGKYKEAQTQYLSVLEQYPSEIEMMLGLGWTYVRQGRVADARAIFERVLTLSRHNLNARAGLEAL